MNLAPTVEIILCEEILAITNKETTIELPADALWAVEVLIAAQTDELPEKFLAACMENEILVEHESDSTWICGSTVEKAVEAKGFAWFRFGSTIVATNGPEALANALPWRLIGSLENPQAILARALQEKRATILRHPLARKTLLEDVRDHSWTAPSLVAINLENGQLDCRPLHSSFSDKSLEMFVGPAEVVQTLMDGVHVRQLNNVQPLHIAFATYPEPDLRQLGQNRYDRTESGKDFDPHRARLKAYAEAVERYCSHQHAAVTVKDLSLLENEDRLVNPRRLIPFRPNEAHHFDERDVYRWVEAEDLIGKQTFVPAQLVFYPYNPVGTRFFWGSSSGVAAHVTEELATANALLEVIERDAFMCHWTLKLSSPRFRTDTLPQIARERIVALRQQYGMETYCIDMTLGSIPIMFVGIPDPNSKHGLYCGASANPDAQQALITALLEAESSYLSHQLTDQTAKPYDSHQEERFDFLFRGPVVPWSPRRSDKSNATAKILASMEGIDLQHVYRIRLTRPDVLDSGVPLHVIRTLVEGRMPMIFGDDLPVVGLSRLEEVRKRYSDRTQLDVDQFYTEEHPFD